ncbi:MAG: thiamine phosphate synthase [Dongiaceae bacterium]
MSELDPPSCRLYLVTPPGLAGNAEPGRFLPVLAAALAAGDVACLRLAGAGRPAQVLRPLPAALVPPAQAQGVAVLVENDPALARAVGADGLHADGDEPKRLSALRKALGESLSLGVACGAERHRAMVAAELGADYVAVDAAAAASPEAFLELIGWWAELMTVPLVAGPSHNPALSAAWARAGADFVQLDPAFWAAADPAAAVAAHQAAIAAAVAERSGQA